MNKLIILSSIIFIAVLLTDITGCESPEPEAEPPALGVVPTAVNGQITDSVTAVPPLFVGMEDSGKTVQIYEDQILVVTLESNATTGFQWELVELDRDVVEEVSNEYVAPEQKEGPPVAGAGGEERWTFQAIKKGTSQLSMEYSRPWEGGEKGVEVFNLTIEVQKYAIGTP